MLMAQKLYSAKFMMMTFKQQMATMNILTFPNQKKYLKEYVNRGAKGHCLTRRATTVQLDRMRPKLTAPAKAKMGTPYGTINKCWKEITEEVTCYMAPVMTHLKPVH